MTPLGLPTDVSNLFATLVVLAFTVAPGLGMAWGLARRAGWDWPMVAAAAFAIGMTLVSAVALFARFLGLTLTFVLWTSLGLALVLTVAGVWLGRNGKALPVRPQAFAIVGACGLLALFERPWMAWTSDTFYHLAAARSLVQTGRPLVTDPFYGTALKALDPTSGVWHTMLALWSKATGIDVIWFWPGAGAVGAAMVVLGFWLVARAIVRTDAAASIATAAFVVTSIYLDFRAFTNPGKVALSVAFVAIVALVTLARTPSWPAVALAVVAGFATFSIHLASAQLVFVFAAVLCFWLAIATVVMRVRAGTWRWRPLAAVVGTSAIMGLTAVPIVLPKADTVVGSSITTFAMRTAGDQIVFIMPKVFVVRPGAMIGGGAGLFYLAIALAIAAGVSALRDDEPAALPALALVGMPAFLLLNPPVTMPLLSWSYYITVRIAALLRFTVFAGIAWGLSRSEGARWRRTVAIVSIGAIVTALLVSLPLLGAVFDRNVSDARLGERYSVPVSRRADQRDIWNREALQQVRAKVGDGYPVVAADPVTGYYLVGLMPVAIITVPPSHTPFAIERLDGPVRSADTSAITDPATSPSLRRALLRKWKARWLLVSTSTDKRSQLLEALYSEKDALAPVVVTPTLVLFEVR